MIDRPSSLPAPFRGDAPQQPLRAEELESSDIHLRDVWATLRRRRWTVLLTMGLIVGLVVAWTVLVTPVWYAGTLIRVDDQQTPAALAAPALEALTGLGGGGSEIDTEMRILRTRPILEDVVDEHDLAFRVAEPQEVPRERLFTALSFGRETAAAAYRIRPAAGTRYRITSDSDETPPLDLEFAPGEPVEIVGGSFVLADLSDGIDRRGRPLPRDVDIETLPFQEAVEGLAEELTVGRPDREANVIHVGYRSTDRVLAHEVPDAVARRFIARRIDEQKTDARSTVTFLEAQVEDTRNLLEGVESQLQNFLQGEQIVALGAEAEAQVQQLATLQTQRMQLEAQRSVLAGLLESIATGGDRADYRRLASFPTFFSNQTVSNMLGSLIQADSARAAMLSRLTPTHPDVVAIDGRIDQLEAQLGTIGQNYLTSLSDQIGSYDTLLERFGSELEQVPERQIEFARIERQVVMLGELYTVLQTRLKEAQVQEAIDDSSVRVVEEAIEPLEPVSPRPVRNLALALAVGLVLGLVLAFVREYMDRRLHSSDRIEALFGLPTIARIPGLALGKARDDRSAALVTLDEPHSVGAESFRNLRTNVAFVRRGDGVSQLMITSPSPGEGKSMTAANLAVAVAQKGRATLLLDADMRRPGQHRQFDVAQTPGLSDCLLADGLLDGAVRPTRLESLSILPAGSPPPNPAELLDSPEMDRLLESLRGRYEAVIIDAPPVLAVTDSAVLAPKTDGVILVVRAERTEKEAIGLAVRQLRQVAADVLGVVVNDAKEQDSYQSYYMEYYRAPDASAVRRLLNRLQGVFS